ncbi:ABC transporter permease [Anaerobranca gottschalkii]|uniref:ABC-2 type transport system permease protein n=1 Tax=Anaerobranca gottschalkii DSM 13577 TaxID=1120990 RepID=A0A1H9YEJ5_9FIRM|nr:ABC-2 family transporter protein [Anaerobranca gottschalkii]SES67308.1 ABC-2 type transport system permease protein [Anaerobranca gottschalkii DSM 13577]
MVKEFSHEIKLNNMLIKIGYIKLHIYKLASIYSIISSLLFIVIQYYLWSNIFLNNKISLYDFNEMFTYLIFSQIISKVYPHNISSIVGKAVSDGDIGLLLLKPISIIRIYFFESIGNSLYRLSIIAIPVFIITSIFFPIRLLLPNILAFSAIFILSYIFVFIFELTIGILSFHTSSLWGIQSFKYAIITVLSGRFLPVTLYPEWAVRIINHLPFRIMYTIPIEQLLGKFSYNLAQILVYQLISIIFLFLIYNLLYKISIKKLMIQGG